MWDNSTYIYTKGILRAIAESYSHIYEGIELRTTLISHPLALVEYKVDFDRALGAIGKGEWTGGIEGRFEDFRYSGRLQQIVIADIFGFEDYDLERLGFYQIGRFKALAYSFMANTLNGKAIGRWGIRA